MAVAPIPINFSWKLLIRKLDFCFQTPLLIQHNVVSKKRVFSNPGNGIFLLTNYSSIRNFSHNDPREDMYLF